MMIKKKFDIPLLSEQIAQAQTIIHQAHQSQVTKIINVGTSLVESTNCVKLAQAFEPLYASVGIHPNDCTEDWKQDLQGIIQLLADGVKNKIVGIGECGLDCHYPGYNLQRQIDAFKAHIELALKHKLPLIVHSRDAADETLTVLHEYKNESLSGVIHCFSEDQSFADAVFKLGFVIGIGGTVTYPTNDNLRQVVKNVPLDKIILETDAPFLPPQIIRGKENSPKYILEIAEFLSELIGIDMKTLAQTTSKTACELFSIPV